MLRIDRRIESHDEVVAFVVYRLKFARGLREKEGAPICDATDDAFTFENESTRSLGDSVK